MTKNLAGRTAPLLVVLALGGLRAAAAEPGPDSWKNYLNARFGYHLEYPDILSQAVEPETRSMCRLFAG